MTVSLLPFARLQLLLRLSLISALLLCLLLTWISVVLPQLPLRRRRRRRRSCPWNLGAVQRDDDNVLLQLANVTNNALELARVVVRGECMPHLRSLTLREATQPPPPGEEGVEAGRALLASMKQLTFLSIPCDCALLCYADALPCLRCLHLECSIEDKAASSVWHGRIGPPVHASVDSIGGNCTSATSPSRCSWKSN
jgi:hypothetical protein